MNTRMKWSLALIAALCVCSPGGARAATAVDDSYTTQRETLLTISAPGLLANDECDSCVVAYVNEQQVIDQITFGGPADGDNSNPPLASGATLTVHSDGSFTYDPSTVADSTVASDSFIYRAQDSRGVSDPATVTITLTDQATNSPPVANSDQYSVELGSVLNVSAPGLLENDTDGDGDPLTVALVDGLEPTFGSPIALSYGTLTIQEDGSFTYEPGSEAVAGADEGFSYAASDGTNLSSSAPVGISLIESTTSNNVAKIRFEDVGLVLLDAEVGLTEADQLEIGSASGTMAQVTGAGLPTQTGALVLRSSVALTGADARNVFEGCERMALVAQAQPAKYDLVVEVQSDTPETSFSEGGDGEVIIEVSETRVRCWTRRVTG